REYFRWKLPRMVGVAKTIVLSCCMIFWNVPASWSAWQWVSMTVDTDLGGIHIISSNGPLFGGGSTMKPCPPTHTTNPVVDAFGSNPWLVPRNVTPNAGGTKGLNLGSSTPNARISGSDTA